MPQTIKIILLLLLVLLLTACARNPLGIPDEEWKQMTPEQQMDARERQAEIDTQRRVAQERQRVLAEIQEQEMAAQRQAALYNARDADVLQCVYRGSHDSHGFELLRGDYLQVFLQKTSGRKTTSDSLLVSFDGMNLGICGHRGRPCQQTAATTRDYAMGVSLPINLSGITGTLNCRSRGGRLHRH